MRIAGKVVSPAVCWQEARTAADNASDLAALGEEVGNTMSAIFVPAMFSGKAHTGKV